MPRGKAGRGGIISLGHGIAAGLKRPTRDSDGAGHTSSPIWPCSGWGLPCDSCYQKPGALLPHPFTLACAPEEPSAVCSLLHFPSPCGARALPGTLPCGARTFLQRNPREPAGDPYSHAPTAVAPDPGTGRLSVRGDMKGKNRCGTSKGRSGPLHCPCASFNVPGGQGVYVAAPAGANSRAGHARRLRSSRTIQPGRRRTS
jgi:hypothetical protein